MDKQSAIARIRAIQGGSGLIDKFPDSMKGTLAASHWSSDEFSLGREYGYIMALMDVFGITEEDLKQ